MRGTIPRASHSRASARDGLAGRRRGLGPLQELRCARAVQSAAPRYLGLAFPHDFGALGHGRVPPAPHASSRDVPRGGDGFVRPARAFRSRIALEQGTGALDLSHGWALAPAATLGDAGQDLPFGRSQVPEQQVTLAAD